MADDISFAAKLDTGNFDAGMTVITGSLLKIGSLAVDALMGAGAAVAGLVGDSIGIAAKFQSSLNSFASVTGGAMDAAGMEVSDFSDLFLEMGAKTAYSAGQAADAAVELAKGGLDPATIAAGGLEGALGLAAAGALDLTMAAEITAKQLGVWSDTGVTAANVADLMAQAANASTVGVQELALGMANVGGVAKLTGVSFEETVQTLALLAPGFSSAADAGTSLKTFLSRLVPSTDKAKEAFIELGLVQAVTFEDGSEGARNAFFDVNGSFIGMEGAAQLLQEAFKDMGEEQKLATLGVLFGSDAIRAGAMIAEAGAEGFNAMGDAMTGAGTAAEQAAKLNQGYAFSMESLKGSFETIQIVIGTALLPILTNLLNNAIIPAANAMLTWAQGTMPLVQAGFEQLGTVLSTLGSYFKFVITDGDQLNDFLASLPLSIQPFALAIGNMIVFIQDNFPLMQATFTTVFGSLQEMIIAVSGFITGTLMPAFATIWGESGVQLPTMQQVFETVMATIAQVMTLVTDFITNTLVPTLTTAVAWVVANWPQIQAKIQEFWAVAQPILQQAADFVVNTLIPKFQEVVSWVVTNWPMIQANVDMVMTAIKSAITVVVGEVVPFFLEKFGEIKAWVDANWPLIEATVKQVIENISTNIHSVIDPLVAFWNDNHETIKAIAETMWENMKISIGNAISIIEGIIKTTMQIITGDWSGAWETIKETVNTVWENMKEIATNNSELMRKIIADKVEELKTWWDAKWTEIQNSVTTIIAGILVTIITKVEEIKSAFTSIDWLKIGTDIIDGIKNGIGNAVGGLVQAATDAAWGAFNAAKAALGISSPSRLFEGIGAATMAGMSLGVEAGVSDAAAVMTAAVLEVGSAFIEDNGEVGQLSGQALVDYYTEELQLLESRLQFPEQALEAARSRLTWANANVGQEGGQAFVDQYAAELELLGSILQFPEQALAAAQSRIDQANRQAGTEAGQAYVDPYFTEMQRIQEVHDAVSASLIDAGELAIDINSVMGQAAAQAFVDPYILEMQQIQAARDILSANMAAEALIDPYIAEMQAIQAARDALNAGNTAPSQRDIDALIGTFNQNTPTASQRDIDALMATFNQNTAPSGTGGYGLVAPPTVGPAPPTTNTYNNTSSPQFVLNATTSRTMQNVQSEFATMQVLAGLT